MGSLSAVPDTMRVFTRKVERNLNDHGMAETVRKIFFFLVKSVYLERTYAIYRCNLDRAFSREYCPDGFVLRVVGKNEAHVIIQIENMAEWLQGRLYEKLSGGLCVAAFEGQRVVGFNLVSFTETYIPLLNLRKTLRPYQAWSDQITVLKDYRRHGLASGLRARIFAELLKRGIRQLYGGTLISNVPSLRLAEKIGFRFIAHVRYQKIFRRERRTYRRIRQ